jgi:hypothetical protein
MALEVLDVVAVLPADLHGRARELSDRLAGRMRANGSRSHFRLGEPLGPGTGGPCEPHVSLFMLAADDGQIMDIIWTMRRLAATLPPLVAVGDQYRHNPVGAPELYFRKSAEWIDLQRSVIAEIEPMRRGRLREVDPAGDRIEDLLADPGTEPARRRQLVRYGYDEVTEAWPGGGPADRFNPHVTLAWPADPASRVELTGLPPAHEFSGTLTELALYGMAPHGTCTRLYGTVPLGGTGTGTARSDRAATTWIGGN